MTNNQSGRARDFWIEENPIAPGVHIASTTPIKGTSACRVIHTREVTAEVWTQEDLDDSKNKARAMVTALTEPDPQSPGLTAEEMVSVKTAQYGMDQLQKLVDAQDAEIARLKEERDNWKRNADARWDALVEYEKLQAKHDRLVRAAKAIGFRIADMGDRLTIGSDVGYGRDLVEALKDLEAKPDSP